jgi:hypothetical protein
MSPSHEAFSMSVPFFDSRAACEPWHYNLTALALILVAICAGCSPTKPTEQIIGKWKGDDSAVGNALRAAKLKSENPGASSDMVRDGARALGNTEIEFSADQKFKFSFQGRPEKGIWSYDEGRKEFVLKLDPPEIPVDHPNPEEAKKAAEAPRSWVVVYNAGTQHIELFMMDQAAIDLLKAVEKEQTKKIGGLKMKKY